MEQRTEETLSPYRTFSRAEWAALWASLWISLASVALAALIGVNILFW